MKLSIRYPNDLWGFHARRRARAESELMRYRGTGHANPMSPAPKWPCACGKRNPAAALVCLKCGDDREETT